MSSITVDKWTVKAQGNLDKVFQLVVGGLAERVMTRTPYGKPELWSQVAPKDYEPGHLRKNWQLGIDEEPSHEVTGVDKGGADTVDAIRNKASKLKGGQVAYLTNTAPYAFCIEYTGHSSQVPAGAGMARAGTKDTVGALTQILSVLK